MRLNDSAVIASEPKSLAHPQVSVGPGAPLNSIEVRPPSAAGAARKWDVFISYAREDKDDVAKPLHDELERLGVSVWYDAIRMAIGDSL